MSFRTLRSESIGYGLIGGYLDASNLTASRRAGKLGPIPLISNLAEAISNAAKHCAHMQLEDSFKWPTITPSENCAKDAVATKIQQLIVAGAAICEEIYQLLRDTNIELQSGSFYVLEDGECVGPARPVEKDVYLLGQDLYWKSGKSIGARACNAVCECQAGYAERQNRWRKTFCINEGARAVVEGCPEYVGDRDDPELHSLIGREGVIAEFSEHGVRVHFEDGARVVPFNRLSVWQPCDDDHNAEDLNINF